MNFDLLKYSHGEDEHETKKPRRSQRINSPAQDPHPSTPLKHNNAQLPSPLTRNDSTPTEGLKDGTVTPPEGRPSQIQHRSPVSSPPYQGLSSPPSDTQPFSQFIYPPKGFSHDVEDEEAEGVWGYLIPLDKRFGDTLVLRKRNACPAPMPKATFGKGSAARDRPLQPEESYTSEEEAYEKNKRTQGIQISTLNCLAPLANAAKRVPIRWLFDWQTPRMWYVTDCAFSLPI